LHELGYNIIELGENNIARHPKHGEPKWRRLQPKTVLTQK
jgi:hypothetical protein